MPQTNYTFPAASGRAGLPGSRRAAELARVEANLNPSIQDEWTVTVGGSASDGTYSVSVDSSSSLLTVVRSTTPASNDDIADEFVATGVPAALAGKIEVFKVSSAVFGIKAKEAGVALVVTAVGEPGSGTLTPSNTVVVANEIDLELGLGVARGTDAGGQSTVALPTTASLATDFYGVTRLNDAQISELDRALTEDGYEAGSMLGVQTNEDIYVETTAAVAKNATPHWVITGANAGKFSPVLVGTAQVTTLTATAEDDMIYRVEVSTSNGKSYSFAIDSGTSSTATTIATALRAAIVAHGEASKHFVGSGTATLILTSLSGVTFDVFAEVIVPATGIDATTGRLPVAFTTPGVVQSHLLEGRKFLSANSAAGIARLYLGA